MVTGDDKIKIVLTEAEVRQAIQKTIQNPGIFQRDNLRNRHPNIQFDCMLRGYIGEMGIQKWLLHYGITLDSTNLRPEGESIDIDFLYKSKHIELKTSQIPDRDGDMDTAIGREDIKLIKREATIEDLRGDIHLQIFFNQLSKQTDTWLETQDIDLNSQDIDYLYKVFEAKVLLGGTYLVSWIDKPSLISNINTLPDSKRTWTFPNSLRQFWKCRIRDNRKPIELIGYLKSL
jgi:hypothetical protein